MVKVKVNDLMQKVYDKFKAAGVSNEQASIVTDLLIYADLRGIHSHGVLRVEHYIERIKAGGINLNSKFNWMLMADSDMLQRSMLWNGL